MSSTARGGVRQEDDFYETQRCDALEALERLRPFLPQHPIFFEPMAGRGALVKLMRELWPDSYVIANEINEERSALLRDAGADLVLVGDLFRQTLQYELRAHAIDCCFTNPAFKFAVPCVTRLRPLAPHVKIMQRTNFLHSAKRLAFWQQNAADLDLLPERPSFAASLSCGRTRAKPQPGGPKAGMKLAPTKDPCGWARIQYLDDPRPKTCPGCDEKGLTSPVLCSTSDSCEYMWAHFHARATRTYHHLGEEIIDTQGVLNL